eukprot:1155545-Pelagomonas_calceolata.AAC.5
MLPMRRLQPVLATTAPPPCSCCLQSLWLHHRGSPSPAAFELQGVLRCVGACWGHLARRWMVQALELRGV